MLGEGGQAGRLSYLMRSEVVSCGRDLRDFVLGNPDGRPTLKAGAINKTWGGLSALSLVGGMRVLGRVP